MNTNSHSYVLITGASSGIGEGFAKAFAKKGRSLVLVARRKERLEKLKQQLSSDKVKIEILPFDLFQLSSAAKLFNICQEKGWVIDGLINNAGLGWQKDLHLLTEEEVDRMLTINLISLTHLCRLFIPQMIKRRSGFILNVASTAAFQAVPHFSVYAATKSYVLSLSESLHEEIGKKGVLVTCLCPGPVHTEFQKMAGIKPRFFARAQNVYEVVEAGMRAIEEEKAVAWTSTFQRLACLGSEFMPHALRRWMAARVLEIAGAIREP